MEYTVNQLAALSGVTKRTLRYYDQQGLLPPKRISSAGYRIYGPAQVDRLQQILFLKQFGLKLEEIKEIVTKPDFDITPLLERQRLVLTQQMTQIKGQLQHLEQTLAYYKGVENMSDTEKFEAFKAAKIAQNQEQYETEIRQRYGDEAVDRSNEKWQHLTKEQYETMQAAETRLFANLEALLKQGTPLDLDSAQAKEAFLAHREWLTTTAPFYNEAYHRTLGEMYVADERFTAYYNDRTSQPSANLLKEIIFHYTKADEE